MRIGSTLLYKDGYCYQSYSWNQLRPLGNLQNALDHLDQYEVDEICVIRPVRQDDSSFKSDIEALKNAKSSTPMAFGGGIRELKHLELLEGLPVERFVFSSALFNSNIELIERVYNKYGEQSIVGFMPFLFSDNPSVFDSSNNSYRKIGELNFKAMDLCDEIVIHDCKAEGLNNGFNEQILDFLNIDHRKLIYSGGVSDIARKTKQTKYYPKSILVENKILHKENSKKAFYGRM